MSLAISVTEPGHLDVAPHRPGRPGPGNVRMRVVCGGICGSDLHILHGTNPFAVYPRVIGHEFAGVVEELGEGVDGLAPGDHVVVDPVISCGTCYPCRIGRPNVCANLAVLGVHRDGGFASTATVPAANAIRVDPALPFGIAALAEPFSIAANILGRTGCTADDHVLLYGAGTVGLTVLQVARLHGAAVRVADPDTARLARARAFGAEGTAVSGVDDVAAMAGEMNGGLGPTLVIDCAGAPHLMREACAVAGPAGRVGLMGFSPEPCEVVQQHINAKELTVYGSRLNRRLIPSVVDWLQSGALQPREMITHTFAAADARAAFHLFETAPQETIKVQLDFT